VQRPYRSAPVALGPTGVVLELLPVEPDPVFVPVPVEPFDPLWLGFGIDIPTLLRALESGD